MIHLTKNLSQHFSLKETEGERMAREFEVHRLKRNEAWMRQGQHQSGLGLVSKGYLRLYSLSETGKEVTQWVCSPGELACDLRNLLFDQPTRWHITALGPTEVYTLPKSRYRTLSEHIPEWPDLERQFLAKCFITLEERSHALLGLNAEARYQHLYALNPTLFQEVPQRYLASMLGMSAETFSRIRRKAIS